MNEIFELTPAGGRPFWFLGAIVLLLLGLVALFGYFAFSALNASLEVTSETLRVRAGLYARTIPLDQLVPGQARRLDLGEERALQPVLRTNGIGLPGYQAGWFKLRDGQKALLHLTDRSRVVYVPTRKGYALLLSVREPEAFLRVLTGTGQAEPARDDRSSHSRPSR